MVKKEGKSKKNLQNLLKFDISFHKTSLTQKMIFVRYLAVMLESGLTISEALEIALDQSAGHFQKVLKSVLYSVRAGNSLSASLEKFPKEFSTLFVSSVYAGEKSGTLDKNLHSLASQIKKDKELKDKIRSAMVYPIIVVGATFCLGLAMAFLVLPKITPLFKGLDMELPVLTKILISFSALVENHAVLLFLLVISFPIFLYWFFRRSFLHPYTHFAILRFPIIKKIAKYKNLSLVCRNLGTMLGSGLNIDEALSITRKTAANYYYISSLKTVTKKINQGSRLSDNLEKFPDLYPKLTSSMIRVGERSGRLEETLFYLSELYDIEVDNSTKRLTTALEPALLLLIGLLVGGMALSIIIPIYQITGSISK